MKFKKTIFYAWEDMDDRIRLTAVGVLDACVPTKAEANADLKKYLEHLNLPAKSKIRWYKITVEKMGGK